MKLWFGYKLITLAKNQSSITYRLCTYNFRNTHNLTNSCWLQNLEAVTSSTSSGPGPLLPSHWSPTPCHVVSVLVEGCWCSSVHKTYSTHTHSTDTPCFSHTPMYNCKVSGRRQDSLFQSLPSVFVTFS